MNAVAQVMQTNRAPFAAENAVMPQDRQQCGLPMAIDVRIRDGLACIAMSGRFDYKTWRNFTRSYAPLVDNAAVREIRVEMIKVDYMDSSALGMLLLLNERATAHNKPVVLRISSGFVLRVLEYARFSQFFNIERSVP